MGRFMIFLALTCVLAAHYAAAQGELTCFFKTSFPKYTSDEQSISVLFTMQVNGIYFPLPAQLLNPVFHRE